MRPNYPTLDRHQVQRCAAEHLQAHLQFRDYKRNPDRKAMVSTLASIHVGRGPEVPHRAFGKVVASGL